MYQIYGCYILPHLKKNSSSKFRRNCFLMYVYNLYNIYLYMHSRTLHSDPSAFCQSWTLPFHMTRLVVIITLHPCNINSTILCFMSSHITPPSLPNLFFYSVHLHFQNSFSFLDHYLFLPAP